MMSWWDREVSIWRMSPRNEQAIEGVNSAESIGPQGRTLIAKVLLKVSLHSLPIRLQN